MEFVIPVSYTHLLLKMEGAQGRREKNAGSKWTEDSKKRHSEKMKEYWRIRKEQGIKN